MKPLRYLGVLLLIMLTACKQKPDTAYQERLKDWTASVEKQIAENQRTLQRMETKLARPSVPFQLGNYKYANYEAVIKLDRRTGETWLMVAGNTNHNAGWIKLGDLFYAPEPDWAKQATSATHPSSSGIDWLDKDPAPLRAGLVSTNKTGRLQSQ